MESLDQTLFVFFNSTIANGFFDWLMPAITDLHKNKFFVFSALPLLLGFWAYKKRLSMVPILLMTVLCVGAADLITYRVLKPTFKRERPPVNEKQIIIRTDRYAGYSFPSNHAANNFAAATFLSFCYPALSIPLFTVAGSIAFSRIYVGVHYPGDVIAGGLLGLIFGLLFYRIWAIILGRKQLGGITHENRHGKSQTKNS